MPGRAGGATLSARRRDGEAAVDGTSTQGGGEAPAGCGQCGAPAPEAEAADEPVTHCEFCGAEYPVPPPPRP